MVLIRGCFQRGKKKKSREEKWSNVGEGGGGGEGGYAEVHEKQCKCPVQGSDSRKEKKTKPER